MTLCINSESIIGIFLYFKKWNLKEKCEMINNIIVYTEIKEYFV